MKNRILGIGLAAAFAVSALGGAAVAADNHSQPGTPGTSNCVGQTNAYLAQAYKANGAPGLGNVGSLFGLSVQQIQAIVQAYCA